VGLPVVLGGMAGYTDLAYRLICRRLGAEFCTTEMMLDKCLLVGRKLLERLAAITEEDHPVAGQIIGNDPAMVARAAGVLSLAGFDAIDITLACPVNKTLKRRRGGYLLNEPDRSLEIVRAVLASCDRPVTVKIRCGVKEAGDAGFWPIVEGAFKAGVAAVTVHARTVQAKYAGRADWAFLAEVKRRFWDRTIVGSGDILTPQAAIDALMQTGVDAVAVARGALGNPWFFLQVKDILAGRPLYQPSLAEQRRLLLGHFEHACQIYGAIRGPKIMRKFGIKYAKLHPVPREVRSAFVGVKKTKDWREVVETLYAPQ